MSASTKTSPCTPPPGLRTKKSRSTRWRIAVLIGVHVLFALHLAHWRAKGTTFSPLEPSEAMEFSKNSIVNAGLIFFALITLSTLVLGRFFCGWACHLVALQDLCRGLLGKIGIRPKPLRSRALALVPLGAFVYMFLWPIAYRMWIGDDLATRGVHLSKDRFWETFAHLPVAIATLAFCGFACVYFLGSKGFCTYACPYGALFGIADKLSPARIRVTDACEGCGHCTITCTSNVAVAQEVRDWGMVVDPGCMKCLDCVSVCPKDALYYGVGKPALGAKPRKEPKARGPVFGYAEEAALAVLFLAALFTFRGLYHRVPFLFSLGIAGVSTYLTVQAWYLVRKSDLKLQNFTLKQAGRLQPAGKGFAALFVVFAVFWAHSAYVKYHSWRADARFEDLAAVRDQWFSSPELTPEEEASARAVRRHAGKVVSAGLLPDALREVELGWAEFVLGDEDAFRTHMQRGVAIAPDHSAWQRWTAAVHLELGHHARTLGDIDEALASYERSALADPRFVDAYEMLGQLLMPARADEFGAIITRGLESDPRSAGLRELHASFLATRGDIPGAEAELRKAIALEPKALTMRSTLAEVLARSGRGPEAIELLEEGVLADPKQPAPLRVLAVTHLVLGDPESADAAGRRALALGKEAVENHRLMARIRTELGDLPGAERHMEEARKAADPGH